MINKEKLEELKNLTISVTQCIKNYEYAVDDDIIDAEYALVYYIEGMPTIQRQVLNVACDKCYGNGMSIYSNTTGWRGGVGGFSVTYDIYDLCWDTGRSDIKGIDGKKFLEYKNS